MGFFRLIFYTVAFIIEIIIHRNNGSNLILFEFYSFYKEFGIGYMILRFAIGFIFSGIIMSLLELIILKELTPNYVLIAYALSYIPYTLIVNEEYVRWIILVISIFQIMSLLFYLEILEFNFCSLNKNTKKSIMGRENNFGFNFEDNEIDSKGYELSDIMKRQEMEDDEENEDLGD